LTGRVGTLLLVFELEAIGHEALDVVLVVPGIILGHTSSSILVSLGLNFGLVVAGEMAL